MLRGILGSTGGPATQENFYFDVCVHCNSRTRDFEKLSMRRRLGGGGCVISCELNAVRNTAKANLFHSIYCSS